MRAGAALSVVIRKVSGAPSQSEMSRARRCSSAVPSGQAGADQFQRRQRNQHFLKADKIFTEQLPAADSADFGDDWLDWLICAIARREARQVLSNSAQ